MALRDTDVETTGSSLEKRRIVLGVTGGIAAVETVRLARALRREGAESVSYTHLTLPTILLV